MEKAYKINDVKGYDDFVKSNNANFFYQRFWLEFLEENSKNPTYLYTEKDKKIKSFLGLSSEESDYYIMPRWVADNVFVKDDIDEFIKEFYKLNSDSVIFENISKKQAEMFEKKGFIIYPAYVHPELRFSSMTEFWNIVGASRRKSFKKIINKAKIEGLEIVNVSSEDDIKEYFLLEKETMKRNNAVASPLEYWRSIYEKVPEKQLLSLLVKKGAHVIAGRISFIDKNKIFNYRGVSFEKFQKYHPNDYLMLHIIEEASKRKIHIIGLGASSINNSGSYLFKKKFSNDERFLWSAVYPLNEKSKKKWMKISKIHLDRMKEFSHPNN